MFKVVDGRFAGAFVFLYFIFIFLCVFLNFYLFIWLSRVLVGGTQDLH